MNIEMISNEGLLFIRPPLPELEKELQFWNITPKVGHYEYVNRKTGDTVLGTSRKGYEKKQELLYSLSPDGVWMVTHDGMFRRVADVLNMAGIYTYTHHRVHPLPEFYFDASVVAGLRPEQIQAVIYSLAASGCRQKGGAVPAPGSGGALISSTMATGKTFWIAAMIRAFRDEKIVITTYRKAVVRRLYDGLNEILNPEGIEVGMVTGEVNREKQITVCTFGSLMNFDQDKTRVLIVDEVHRAAGEDISGVLLEFKRAVKFGCSGTIKGHIRERYLESIFGPIAFSFEDEEAEELDRVSKVKVYALSVPKGPPATAKREDILERHCITRNKVRNRLIRDTAALVPEDMQLIIFVRTIEHIDLLVNGVVFESDPEHPEVPVKDPIPPYLPPGYEIYHGQLPPKEKRRIEEGLYSGEIKRLIANDSLSEGVDTTKLRVMIDANWWSSDCSVSQKGGRNRRKDEGKYLGIIINFQDEWCDILRKKRLEELRQLGMQPSEEEQKADFLKGKADKRLTQYRKRGWPVLRIDSPDKINFNEINQPEIQQTELPMDEG